ncbi:MAG: DNA alkylation repair protein [Candidatus Cloacimonetes bacterium]|nr:DNA alkylation repair protein [Candidatus Cloacimonadota bacterium]
MIKDIGRLNLDDYKLIDAQVEKIFLNLSKDKIDLARKQITEMANTPNYFVREEMGKRLAAYEGPGAMESVCAELLEDHIYGIRATALFYFYYSRQDDIPVIIKILEKTFESVPWESETILFDLWKRDPETMKNMMPEWATSDNEKKRAMSMHGMENIAQRNPQYVLTFIARILDDESEEVQKKISHVLTQVGRYRPLHTYVNIRRWLQDGDEDRARTLWNTMKKLANLITDRNQKDQSPEFVSTTRETIAQWRKDKSPLVAQMGNRLYLITRSG